MAEEEIENETTDDMSEGEDGEDGEEEQGSGKKKLIIIVAVVVLLLGGGGAAAYFTGMLDSVLGVEIDCENIEEGEPHFVECEAKRIAEGGDANSDGPGEFYEVPNLIVNLNTTGRQPRFLKISIQLEVDNEGDVADLEKIAPRIIDHFQTYLRELRVEDLRGSSGIYRLRMELLSRVRAAAPDIHVRDVLFQEILIQ